MQDPRERPFRIESAWLTHDSFKNSMCGWWQSEGDLDQKLANVEGELRIWKHTTFGCMRTKKRTLLTRLGGIQKQSHAGNINKYLCQLEKNLQGELNEILYREELM